jgi:DNA primase
MQDQITYQELEALRALDRRDCVPCPLCRYGRQLKHQNERKLRIWPGRKPGVLTYACAHCGAHGVVYANGEGWRDRHHHRPCSIIPAPATNDDPDRNRRYARKLYNATRPAPGTLTEVYLKSRGITILPTRLRFHPNLRHPTGITCPAMLAPIISATGEFRGIQRTYLRADGRGKADLDPNKLSLGSIAGCGVWLGDSGVVTDADGHHRRRTHSPGLVLIAEGIETTLSAMQLFHRPAWAALGATLMERLDLPELHRDLLICADRDQAGVLAAHAAGERWATQGRHVRVVQPPDNYKDWNDLIRGRHS